MIVITDLIHRPTIEQVIEYGVAGCGSLDDLQPRSQHMNVEEARAYRADSGQLKRLF